MKVRCLSLYVIMIETDDVYGVVRPNGHPEHALTIAKISSQRLSSTRAKKSASARGQPDTFLNNEKTERGN